MPAVIWTCLFLLGFVQCGMRFLLNTFKLKKKNYGKKKTNEICYSNHFSVQQC